MQARVHAFALCAALGAAACAAPGQGQAPASAPPSPALQRPPGPEAVRTIRARVPGYYKPAGRPGVKRWVGVGRSFDALLASDRREDVIHARELLTTDPELITPMTMMALAIRLYEVGLRDDAVFWFYAARYRYQTIGAVLDFETSPSVDIRRPMDEFVRYAQPAIDGYARCDPEKREDQRRRALDWVEAHPYGFELVLTQLRLQGERRVSRSGAPAENVRAAIAWLRAMLRTDREWLDAPGNRGKLERELADTGATARYCWDWAALPPVELGPPGDPACGEPTQAEEFPGWKVCFELPELHRTVQSLCCAGASRQTAVTAALAAPEKLAPPALCALARALLDAGRPEEALFWNEACLLRARIDRDRCLEPSAVVRELRDEQGKRFVALQAEDPDRLAKAVDRALSWDRRTARLYDHRWVQLHTARGGIAPPSIGCQDPPFAPEDQWPAISERARAAFERGYRQELARPKAADGKRPTYRIIDGEVMDWEKVLREIDPLTFEPLAGDFVRDAAHVYYRGRAVPGADPGTFQVIAGEFARDGRAVFRGINRCRKCDPGTFRRLGQGLWADHSAVYVELSTPGQCQLTSPGSPYMDLELCDNGDRSDLAGHPELDPATTVRLGPQYVKDRSHVLWYWDPVPGADAATFTVDGRGVRDRLRCYRGKDAVPCPAE